MDKNKDEQMKHLKQLKKCEKVYAVISVSLFATHIPYVIAAAFITVIALLTQAWETLFYFMQGVVIAASLVLNMFGITTKDMKCSAGVVLLNISNTAVSSVVMTFNEPFYDLAHLFVAVSYLFTAGSIAVAVLNFIFGGIYHYLEQCEGFPYFNSLSSRLKEKADEPKDYEYYRKMHRAREELFTKDETANGTTGGSKGEMSEITIDTAADTTANGTGASQGTMDDI